VPVADSGTVAEILAGSGWPGLEDNQVRSHWQRLFDQARTLAALRTAEGRRMLAAEAARGSTALHASCCFRTSPACSA
jgi:pyruvate,water dikinase